VTAVRKTKPQVTGDEEHERVHERVAAVDVARDSGMVCTRLPHPSRPGARQSTVWTVRARMAAIRTLGRQLARDGIEVVTLEPASDYWRIWFFVLEACGLAVQLVSEWLARLTEMGLLRPSFVPPKPIRDLRDYTRMRTRLIQERTRCFQRPGKAAGGRAGQAVLGGQQADHYLRAGHDQGDDRRPARSRGAG
jgi:transposase